MAAREWEEDLNFAIKFAANLIERLDEILGAGAAQGGAGIRIVHKSSPAWEEVDAEGEWEQDGCLCYRVKDEYYVLCTSRAPEDSYDPSATFVEIYVDDHIVEGHMYNQDAIRFTAKGGSA